MTAESEPVEQTRLRLKQFLDLADAVWDSYRNVGPGRVDGTLFLGIEELADSLPGQIAATLDGETEETSAVVPRAAVSHIERIRDLCRRCVHRPEGLCFITGEAGLIPRADLHEAFESSLTFLRQQMTIRSPASEQGQSQGNGFVAG